MMRDNVIERGNPLALPANKCASWAFNLKLPRTGDTILYTGCEYQLIPYALPLIDRIKKMGRPFGFGGGLTKLAFSFKKLRASLIRTFARLSAKDKAYYDGILIAYATILEKLGIRFAYLHEEEPYAGALLYEFGFLDDFIDHAKKVGRKLKKRGIKKMIVLSPHSLEMFRNVYPQYMDDFDIETLHFTEALLNALDDGASLTKPFTITIHDPCHLARTLGIIEEPRKVLASIENLEVRETPHTSGRWTMCCGAPIEMLFPELSEMISSRRVEELANTGSQAILTLCPFCLANLRRGRDSASAGVKIMDFAELLLMALG